MNYLLRNHEISENGRSQALVELWKGDMKVLSMLYDVLLHTARMESLGNRRLFLVYGEGRRHPKTVFTNEYGFDVGIIEETLDEKGFGNIKIYNKVYYYKLPEQPGGTLAIYADRDGTPEINITTEIMQAGIFTGAVQQTLPLRYFYCVLMSICWYLELPVKQKEKLNTSQVAAGKQTVRM